MPETVTDNLLGPATQVANQMGKSEDVPVQPNDTLQNNFFNAMDRQKIQQSVTAFGLGTTRTVRKATGIGQIPEDEAALMEHPLSSRIGEAVGDIGIIMGISRGLAVVGAGGAAGGGFGLAPKIAEYVAKSTAGIKAGQAFSRFKALNLNPLELERYIGKAIHSGMVGGVYETIKEMGSREPDKKLLASAADVAGKTMWWVGLGAASAAPTLMKRAIGAGTYGGLSTLLNNGSPADVAINTVFFGAAEVLGGKGIDRELKLKAKGSLDKALYQYFLKRGMPYEEAAKTAIDIQAKAVAKAGGLEAVLEQNSTQYMNAVASALEKANPAWRFSAPKNLTYTPKPDGTPRIFDYSKDTWAGRGGAREWYPSVLESALGRQSDIQSVETAMKAARAGGKKELAKHFEEVLERKKGEFTPEETMALIRNEQGLPEETISKIIVPSPQEILGNKTVSVTKQAENFAEQYKGREAEAIQALETKRQELVARQEELRALGDKTTDAQDQEGYDIGQTMQYYREAKEALQGKITAEKIAKGREALELKPLPGDAGPKQEVSLSIPEFGKIQLNQEEAKRVFTRILKDKTVPVYSKEEIAQRRRVDEKNIQNLQALKVPVAVKSGNEELTLIEVHAQENPNYGEQVTVQDASGKKTMRFATQLKFADTGEPVAESYPPQKSTQRKTDPGVTTFYRKNAGKKLFEDMSEGELKQELSDLIIQDMREAVKTIPAGGLKNYLEDRASDPLDPLNELHKILLAKYNAGELKASVPAGGKLRSEFGKLRLPTAEDREGLYQKIFNRFQSIENTVEKAKKLGADIKPGEDAGISADRYLSVSGQAENTLRKGTYIITPEGNVQKTGEGYAQILKDIGTALKGRQAEEVTADLDTYLKNTRMVEDLQRPAEGRKKNIASKQQVKDAKAALKELKKKYGDKLSVFQKNAERIYDFEKRVLHKLVDAGNFSQKQYDAIVAENPHYIPFERILPDEGLDSSQKLGKELFGKKAPVSRIKGSDLPIENTVESVIKNTHKIENAASRNKVFKDIYALKDIEGLEISAAAPDMTPIKLTAKEGGGQAKTIFRPSPIKPKGRIVQGYIDGQRKFLEVPQNLYDAMTGLNEISSNWAVRLASIPASSLRVGATSTPEFIARNLLRDQWTALLQTQIGFKPFIDTIGAIAHIVKKDDVYDQWLRSGGAHAGFVELSRPALGQMLKEIQGNKEILKNVIFSPQAVSQVLEQATRLAVYKKAKTKGVSDVEAARTARESTLNFQRRGSATKEFNMMTAFFNAELQSRDKFVRTVKKDPGGVAFKGLVTITIPSILLYFQNHDDPEYKELPRWVKDLFWNFKVGDQWYRVPKPFIYGQVFGSLPERFLEYLETKDPGAFEDFNESLYDALSPVTGDPIGAMVITAIKPFVESKTNWSFFLERELVSEKAEKLIPAEQYGRFTTETAKKIGETIGVSPAKLENFVTSWTGGSGRYALQAGDKFLEMVAAFNGDEPAGKRPGELADIPLVKGFVSRGPTGVRAQSVSDFYDDKERINALSLTYKKYAKEGNEARAEALLKNNPELELDRSFNSVGLQINALSREIDAITAADMPEEQKRQEIKELEDSQVELAKEANALLEGIKGREQSAGSPGGVTAAGVRTLSGGNR